MFALLKMKNYASVSQQKVFWNNQTFPNMSRSIKLIMAIVTVLAIMTVLAIVTILVIVAIVSIVVIVNIVAIKTVIYLSGIKSSIKYKGLVLG